MKQTLLLACDDPVETLTVACVSQRGDVQPIVHGLLSYPLYIPLSLYVTAFRDIDCIAKGRSNQAGRNRMVADALCTQARQLRQLPFGTE